jgi:hypothetical protein
VHHHLVVTLADKEFVMKSLVFGKLEVCYLGFGLLIMMD